jgi:hypothetical protein
MVGNLVAYRAACAKPVRIICALMRAAMANSPDAGRVQVISRA